MNRTAAFTTLLGLALTPPSAASDAALIGRVVIEGEADRIVLLSSRGRSVCEVLLLSEDLEILSRVEIEGSGVSVAGIGDVDGDLTGEVAVAVLREAGADLRILSGRDLFHLNTIGMEAEAGIESFGRAICGREDFDGDGVADLAVTAARDQIWMYSGRSGLRIGRFERPRETADKLYNLDLDDDAPLGGLPALQDGGFFGASLLMVPGTTVRGPMLLVGSSSPCTWAPGFVYAYDEEGDLLWVAGSAQISIGSALALLHRIDDKGTYVAAGASGRGVSVFDLRLDPQSGTRGDRYRIHFSPDSLRGQAGSLDTLPDHDGDGVEDLLIGSVGDSFHAEQEVVGSAMVWLHSGADGEQLRQHFPGGSVQVISIANRNTPSELSYIRLLPVKKSVALVRGRDGAVLIERDL